MSAQPAARSLMPKEHGAYGQLALPLVTALLSGRFQLAAILFTVAALCAFFAHEPALLLLGQRGSRALREAGERARVRLALLMTGALLCGGLGLMLADAAARLALLAPLGASLLLALFVWRRQERTDLGEIVAAMALSATAVPVAIAAGLSTPLAFGVWGVWSLGFGLVTLSLRRAIHRRGEATRRRDWAVALPALLAGAGWLIAHTTLTVALAALPTVVMALGLFILPPSPKHLHRTGWLLVLTSVVTSGLLVFASRTAGQ